MTTVSVPLVPLSDLHELLSSYTSTACVYLGPVGPEWADPEWGPMLRRRRIARHLAEQGSPNVTIDAILGHLARLPEWTSEYAVFARDGRIVLAQHVPGSTTELAANSAPPKIAPLLAWYGRQIKENGDGRVDIAGVGPTVRALAEGRVRRLVIVDDPADSRLGWFGPDLLCGLEQDGRFRYAQRGRLTDIAIRAAVLTGAEVTVLTAGEGSLLAGGMAALLTP